MFADMVGYTALMQRDEDTALAQRDRYRRILSEHVERDRGQILQYYGDGALCIFGSAVQAVQCAVQLQKALSGDPGIPARIGLHAGDIVRDDEGVYGDGVNLASRMESLAAAGGVMISKRVYDEIKNHTDITTAPMGAVHLKGVSDAVHVFALANEGLAVPTREEVYAKARPATEAPKGPGPSSPEPEGPVGKRGLGEAFLSHVRDAAVLQWSLIYAVLAWMALAVVQFTSELNAWSSLVVDGSRLVLFAGFFVAVVVAWFHGEKGRQRIQGVEIVIVGLLVVGAGAALSLLRSRAASAPDPRASVGTVLAAGAPSVAILPFQNLSVEEENAYFASGLHQEVLTQLQQLAGLRVISRASVMEYEVDRPNVRAIADNLGVSHVAEGSVQRIGDRLRVNVQLIDAGGDQQVWAQRYDRELNDAFAVQSDIAQHVATALTTVLTVSEREAILAPPTVNPEAYRFYLQGRDYSARPGYREDDFTAAERLFQRAIQLDPSFALARAQLSIVHGRIFWENHDPTESRLEAQRAQAQEALRLQPDLPQGHVALGWVHYVRGDYRAALDEYRIALERRPNDGGIHAAIGYAHRRIGEWEEVHEAFEKAAALNPRNANLFYDLGGHSFGATRRYADAVAAYDHASTLAPDLYDAAIKKGMTYAHWQGQLDTLRTVIDGLPGEVHLPEVDLARAEFALWDRDPEALRRVLDETPGRVFDTQVTYFPKQLYAAWAHRLTGDEGAATGAFDAAAMALEARLAETPEDERVVGALAYAYAGLGMTDGAARMAERIVGVAQRTGAPPGAPEAELAARIFAQAGNAERALPYLEVVLASQTATSRHTLRLDPLFDPIRHHPGFEALLEGADG